MFGFIHLKKSAGWRKNVSIRQWKETDRQLLLVWLRITQEHLVSMVQELTENQFMNQLDTNQWSIGKIMEYLIKADKMHCQELTDVPYRRYPITRLQRTDIYDDLNWMDDIVNQTIIDVPRQLVPTGLFGKTELIREFIRGRAELIAFVNITSLDFKTVYTNWPTNADPIVLDLHQYVLAIIACTQRYIADIKKIKADQSALCLSDH
ncbi:hypothetical protein IC229_11735 [Spirosoma sp. BT702]|uniref:DinB family protein n=1 Tax=Spirosoma profusum TaxID=2771354 RepID=A0A926XZV9_9BACT|nr:hypothetical protein [Spirosoma profusum]MBD2701312.1 hypothetical protein [Spirosoma profusum]